MIEMNNVVKDYKTYSSKKGFLNQLYSIFKRDYSIKRAVDHLTLHIDQGEIVGYVGPNGAGKSTTIKMLSGILVPTEGTVRVNGRNPCEKRIQNAMDIGVVFGQRSQLYWDLPVEDSFLLHKRLYNIENRLYQQNVSYFIEILEMGEFLQRPVRLLSLGQRMRANIAISMLHNPKIVYLDEPTIGLDIVAKNRIRDFITTINSERNTTVILTTHDMDDIEDTCRRLIIIDEGVKQYDGTLNGFKEQYGDNFQIEVVFDELEEVAFNPPMYLIKSKPNTNKNSGEPEQNENRKTIMCDKHSISIAEAVTFITSHFKIKDIRIIESNIEEILLKLYARK
jgi:ABC-2 type transport system ATP-binding protein